MSINTETSSDITQVATDYALREGMEKANEYVAAVAGPYAKMAKDFGFPQAEKVLHDGLLDFENCVSEQKAQVFNPIHCNLAVSFGKSLDQESVKMMDDELKIMISGSIRSLQRLQEKLSLEKREMTWEDVMAEFSQNSLMERDADSERQRTDKLIKEDTNFFKVDGSPERSVVEEVKTWFNNLLYNDNDILSDTKIDIDELANIVAATGAAIDGVDTFFYSKTSNEKEVIDIGVLRYPDIDHPYIKVYHIKLVAWSTCTRVTVGQADSNGIIGEFNSIHYKPRKSVMDELRSKVKKKAIAEADALFGFEGDEDEDEDED